LAALHVELQEIKGLGLTRHGAGDGDLGLPRSMRLEGRGFNLEGDAAEWFRWMLLNKLINDWDEFLESVRDRSETVIAAELLVSKPTTLGDAFSLARVTEARFEDQGMKPVSNKAISASGEGQNQKGTPPRFIFSRLKPSKRALLLTLPKPSSNACTTPLPIKWILPVERQERLSKGLCFNRDNKWVRGHKYRSKFLLLMADDVDGADQETPKAYDEALESGDISILNSLVGHGSPHSLQLWGVIDTGHVHVLIDNGSTHNFVQPDVVEQMQLHVATTKPFKVYIDSGETLLCENMCSKLQKLGKVTHDYAKKSMEFTLANKTYTLQGDASLRMKQMSLHHMQALLETDEVYGVYELYSVAVQDEEIESTQVQAGAAHPEIEQLLARFEALFQVHTTLPPHRLTGHSIHLYPSTKHVNVRPYRYPHYQKVEMEKIEMDPKKVAAIVNWPVPKAQRKVRSFLGTVEATALEALKHQLSHAPILGLPNFDETFIVETDALTTGIGQKELFAIVKTIYKKLMGFDFIIEYKPEVSNQVADALSRMYEEDEGVTTTFMAMSQPLVDFLAELCGENEGLEELQRLHQKIDQGEELVGFRREQGLLIYQYRYYIRAESKLKRAFLSEFHTTPSARHGGIKKILVGLSALFSGKECVNQLRCMLNNVLSVNKPCNASSRRIVTTFTNSNNGLGGFIKMSPFQALYGRLPLAIIPYLHGSSKVAAFDKVLSKRDELLRQLRHNLLDTKNRMEMKANHSRRDVEFKREDLVFVKLQPYRQLTLAKHLSNKLSKRYYGPFKVLERVRKVSYCLALPSTSKIHLVFHVSLLKPFEGTEPGEVSNFPEDVFKSLPEEATWEWLTDFQDAYPTYHLEDKVISKEEGNVTSTLEGIGRVRAKRVTYVPAWHKDYLIG
nr:hypothetical protein [Tanacetum cinerariifolium]